MSIAMLSEFADRFGPLKDRGWFEHDSGLVLPPSAKRSTAQLLGLDLFAGAGGFSCGFHQAGWHVIAASEWWPLAVETYICNLGSPDTVVYVGETAAPDATKKERALFERHGGTFIGAAEFFDALPTAPGQEMFGPGTGWISGDRDDYETSPCEVVFCCDVHELSGPFILDSLGLERGDLGVVFGGPPCQGFSRANGKRSASDGRNQLVFEFARLVCELQPKSMVMENVPGILEMFTPEGVPVIDALSLILEDGGMGEYDALRKSLAANAGAGAIVKGTKRPTRAARAAAHALEDGFENGADDLDEQLALEVAT